MSVNDLFGATADDLKACQAMFQRYRNNGIFTPPSLEGSIHVPGNIGGMHWGGAAWDPETTRPACHRVASAGFGWDRVFDGYFDTYRELIDGAAAARMVSA